MTVLAKVKRLTVACFASVVLFLLCVPLAFAGSLASWDTAFPRTESSVDTYHFAFMAYNGEVPHMAGTTIRYCIAAGDTDAAAFFSSSNVSAAQSIWGGRVTFEEVATTNLAHVLVVSDPNSSLKGVAAATADPYNAMSSDGSLTTGGQAVITIIIDPDQTPLTTTQQVHVIAHEMGHILGLHDVYCRVALGDDPETWPTTDDALMGSGVYTLDTVGAPDLNGLNILQHNPWNRNSNGQLQYWDAPGTLASGWKAIGTHNYYFNPTTNVRQIGWLTLAGAKYHFDFDGTMQTGLIQIGSFKYYFAPDTGVLQTGWVQFNEGERYFSPIAGSGSFDGHMLTGLQTINDQQYYFNSSGIMQIGWVTLGTWHHYFNNAGVMVPNYSWQESVPGSGSGSSNGATYGSISLEISSVEVEQGKQINLLSNNNVYATGTNGDYHLDFGVAGSKYLYGYGPSDRYVGIDKHTGVLTGLEIGTTTLYVFLTPANAPLDNPSIPCETLLDIEAITVTVIASSEYGFQGRDNALYMNFPAVDYWEYNTTDGYVNGFDTPLEPDDDNNLHFEYTQLVGFDYILPTTYVSDGYNGFNVMLLDSNGMVVRWFEWPIWPESIIIEAYHPEYKTIELIINMDNLPSGNYRLQFTQNFTGDDNDGYSRTLGVPVTFAFSV